MVINNLNMASINILLSSWESVNVVPKVATEGTPLRTCAVFVLEEIELWVICHRCKGGNSSRDKGWNRGLRLQIQL